MVQGLTGVRAWAFKGLGFEGGAKIFVCRVFINPIFRLMMRTYKYGGCGSLR